MIILKKNNYLAVLRGKLPLISSILAAVIIGVCFLGAIMPQRTNANITTKIASYTTHESNPTPAKTVKTIDVVVTAYSSTSDQTDDTPFITASGMRVADGIVANNLLPLGTKIKIPELYGDKIFTVEDRMNRDKSNYHVDLWMPSRSLALNFGIKTAQIEVLQD